MVKYWKTLLNFLLIYSIIMSAIGITLDTVNILKYGSVDLRNRVVGTRLLLSGEDPYFFKWDKNTPEEIVDARDFYSDLPVSRLTVPPSVLLLHVPFSVIPYKSQQILWAAMQWLLLFLSIVLLANTTDSIIKKKILWIIGLFIIASSFFWRLHIDKGQIYILYICLIILSYWLLKKRNNEILSGFILGITAFLRPPLILIGIPFLITRRWKFIVSGVSGIVVIFFCSLMIAPIKIWKSYFNSMEFHEKFHLLILNPVYKLYDKYIVDGIRYPIFSANLPIEDSSIQDLLRIFCNVKIKAFALELSLIFVLIILTASLWRRIAKAKSDIFLFYIGSVYVIISSFFLPAARLSYMNVYWLLPLALYVIQAAELKQILKPELLLLLAGSLLNTAFNLFPKGIILSDYLMLTYFIVIMYRITNENLPTNT